ncbi:hypothetical protein DERP_011081 [Dermatophagoides pteronyssinus]|uniref:Transmembrane protein n=1 Tax=Dermatophagoides pteronyssinus TaxID=6956 RepID=A0ABQ8J8T2_DERPT|nr:hypothetical protein DERP_011081 [Dermatophagoides pteronyssinus]
MFQEFTLCNELDGTNGFMNVCIMMTKLTIIILIINIIIFVITNATDPDKCTATLADIRGCNNGGAKYHVFVIGLYLSTDFKLFGNKKKKKIKLK